MEERAPYRQARNDQLPPSVRNEPGLNTLAGGRQRLRAGGPPGWQPLQAPRPNVEEQGQALPAVAWWIRLIWHLDEPLHSHTNGL